METDKDTVRTEIVDANTKNIYINISSDGSMKEKFERLGKIINQINSNDGNASQPNIGKEIYEKVKQAIPNNSGLLEEWSNSRDVTQSKSTKASITNKKETEKEKEQKPSTTRKFVKRREVTDEEMKELARSIADFVVNYHNDLQSKEPKTDIEEDDALQICREDGTVFKISKKELLGDCYSLCKKNIHNILKNLSEPVSESAGKNSTKKMSASSSSK